MAAGIAFNNQLEQGEHRIFNALSQYKTLGLRKLHRNGKQPVHVIGGLCVDVQIFKAHVIWYLLCQTMLKNEAVK